MKDFSLQPTQFLNNPPSKWCDFFPLKCMNVSALPPPHHRCRQSSSRPSEQRHQGNRRPIHVQDLIPYWHSAFPHIAHFWSAILGLNVFFVYLTLTFLLNFIRFNTMSIYFVCIHRPERDRAKKYYFLPSWANAIPHSDLFRWFGWVGEPPSRGRTSGRTPLRRWWTGTPWWPPARRRPARRKASAPVRGCVAFPTLTIMERVRGECWNRWEHIRGQICASEHP